MPTSDERDQRKVDALERIVSALEEVAGQLQKTNEHLFQIRHGGLKKAP